MTGERDRPVRSREKRKKEKREKRIARPHYIPKVIHIQITEYELKISTRENKKKSGGDTVKFRQYESLYG